MMVNSLYNYDKANVLFVTLDCCRYDTFALAYLPFLKSLGEAQKAHSHGTYTLPAHMSFFMGYLPTANESQDLYYNPAKRQLWRLASGRARSLENIGLC